MHESATSPEPASKRRLSPDARRQEIIDAARALFAERPLSSVSTADVAEAAGVTRSLVHHYFGGIGELFLAVAAHSGAALADVRTKMPPTPLEERLAHNVPAGLDVVEQNRETWYAVMGHAHSSGNAQADALAKGVQDLFVQRSLEVNSDVITDTPTTRAVMVTLNALSREAVRQWLDGHLTREQTEALLITTWRNILLHTIPATENATEND